MKAAFALLAAWVLACAAGAQSTDAETARQNATAKVYVLPVEGPIDKAMLFVFRRAFHEAKKMQPDAVIVDLNTPGGGLRETKEIISWIRSVKKTTPVYAFVNPDALSAGAIISLGCSAIFMSPAGTIGSAMPIAISPFGGVQQLPEDIQEKMLSAVRAMVRGLAQENGYSEDIAVAMVDPDAEVIVGDEVISAKGKLLNLPARTAVQVVPPNTDPLLAKAIVEDIDALLDYVGMPDATVTRFEEKSAERLARWITTVGPLLLALGALLLYIEIKTPGFGLPGIGGLTLLAIYFFGHYVAGLAGQADIVLIIVGILLLAVELFVIPGFGFVGIAGLCCILVGSVMALIPFMPDDVTPLPNVEPVTLNDYIQDALQSLTISVLLVGVGVWLLGKVLPKTSLYRALIVEGGLSKDKGYVSSDVSRNQTFLGRQGVALTFLRPAGTAAFGDDRLDVVSSGDLIPRGTPVTVVQVQGGRVVVEKAEPQSTEPEQPENHAV
jgi:membrane-bound serine protease (ClpP class)